MLSSSTGSGSNDTNMVLGSATSPGGARGGFAGQWLVVGAVGLMLGLCTLAFYVVPQRFALVFVLALLAPCVMMAVGHVRRVLLAVIILDTSLQLGTFN